MKAPTSFGSSIANAEAAGAVAVVVYSNVGAPIVMNNSGTIDVHIPAVMIGNADGQRLVDRLAADAGKNLKAADRVTVKLALGIFDSLAGTLVAFGFSALLARLLVPREAVAAESRR